MSDSRKGAECRGFIPQLAALPHVKGMYRSTAHHHAYRIPPELLSTQH